MNKHTKGPWRAEIGPINSLIHTKDKSIACTYTANTTPEEAEANARLIAAAPELCSAAYNALQALYAMPKSKQAFYQYLINDLRTSIQRVEGILK